MRYEIVGRGWTIVVFFDLLDRVTNTNPNPQTSNIKHQIERQEYMDSWSETGSLLGVNEQIP